MDNYYIILSTSVIIAFVHTILGPDHYIPFVALSKSMSWSLRKTLLITIICGIGHVLSSVLLGILGIMFGENLLRLVDIESKRGELAALLLLIFSFTYF
ncbi:MAG: hypothetical protein SVN78_10340 [Deferribacterota bacterium]|nr:hypothetical protein [Deferribacterota bacterium]